MKIHYGRLAGIAAVATAAMFAAGPLCAGQDVEIAESNAEDSLLGMHLLDVVHPDRTSTFRDVLKKYGQPSEIQAGGPYSPTPPPSAATASSGPGGMMGGMMGLGGMGGGKGTASAAPNTKGKMGMGGPGSGGGGGAPGMGGGGGSKQTSKNGFPGDNGGGGGGGAMGGGAMGRGMGGPGSGGPGMPGKGGQGMGGPGSGLPGFGSGGPGSGGPGMGFPGGEGDEGGTDELGAGTSGEDNAPVKETTWWYHDPQSGLHMSFVFNRVGQIIQIGEYGPKKLQKMHNVPIPNAGATRRGLVLGNSMGAVIGKYGWSLDGAHDGDNVIMRFGHRDKVAFQMVHNAILGITIGVTRPGPALATHPEGFAE